MVISKAAQCQPVQPYFLISPTFVIIKQFKAASKLYFKKYLSLADTIQQLVVKLWEVFLQWKISLHIWRNTEICRKKTLDKPNLIFEAKWEAGFIKV